MENLGMPTVADILVFLRGCLPYRGSDPIFSDCLGLPGQTA
jgi:hypothetical protein